MLVLSRKPKESIQIGDNIRIVIVEVRAGIVRVGIEAHRDLKILRSELVKVEPST